MHGRASQQHSTYQAFMIEWSDDQMTDCFELAKTASGGL